MATIAIVGAGPAGMAASVAAVEGGCDVVLIDEAPVPGGQIYRQPPPPLKVQPIGTPQELARKKALLDAFERVRPRIRYRPATTAHSLYAAGLELQVADETESLRMTPDAVILATGVSERCVPFPGWTLPGVLYAGGAQALLKAQGTPPGRRVVVAGVGALPLVVGAQLSKAGVQVAAVAMLHPFREMAKDPLGLFAGWRIVLEGLRYQRWLRQAGVPVLEGWAPVRAEGDEAVRRVVLAPVDADGKHLMAQARDFEVDCVAVNFGFNANSELVRMAGATAHYDPIAGGWLPKRDAHGRTSLERVYVAGDGAGLRGALVAAAEGRIVGAAAAADLLGSQMAENRAEWKIRAANERFQKALRRTLALPDGVWGWSTPETIVCRCECVTRERIDLAVSEGHCTLNGLKRNTRVGMGWCGGRTCLQAAAAYVQGGQIVTPPEPMRARPVARPVKLGALVNTKVES